MEHTSPNGRNLDGDQQPEAAAPAPLPPAQAASAVPELHANRMDERDFSDATAAYAEPAIVRSVLGPWQRQHWDLRSLWTIAPTRQVLVDAPAHRYETSLERATAHLIESPGSTRLSGMDLDRVLPEMGVGLTLPDFVPDERLAVGCTRQLTVGVDLAEPMRMRADEHGIRLALQGRQRVLVYPPDVAAALSHGPWFGGRGREVEMSCPDIATAPDRFDAIVGQRPITVDLAPGDAVFLPVHWWSAVYGVGDTVSVTTAFRARAREWTHNQLALKSAASRLMGAFRSGASSASV